MNHSLPQSGRLPRFIVTLDTDWAPDYALITARDLLVQYGVKATWFITHWSPAIESLKQYPELFELGLHPNFLAQSSHGSTPEEVWKYIKNIVPEAVSIRTHGLYQTTQYYIQAIENNLRFDLSTFLPHHPCPIPTWFKWGNGKILRIPFVWEDDIAFEDPTNQWSLNYLPHTKTCPAILNFHPIHIFLNSSDSKIYRELKKNIFNNECQSEILVNKNQPGVKSLFTEVLKSLSENSIKVCEYGSYF